MVRPSGEPMPVGRRIAWDPERAARRIEELRHLPGAVLPILHALQAEFGYIDRAAVPLVADALNLSRAEVHGVVSFYHDFREAPPGRHVLKLCRAEACQSMGGDALAAETRERLGVGWGETTPDGRITLEPVFCLGLCACAPAAMIDGRVVGRLDRSRLAALIDATALGGPRA
jgi:formate dehydrogenase subunit gamma